MGNGWVGGWVGGWFTYLEEGVAGLDFIVPFCDSGEDLDQLVGDRGGGDLGGGRWVGGWVGGKVEEKEAVRTRCRGSLWGRWVGGWVGGRETYLGRDRSLDRPAGLRQHREEVCQTRPGGLGGRWEEGRGVVLDLLLYIRSFPLS